MILEKAPSSELEKINELVFKPCGFNLKNIQAEAESQQYAAHAFQLNQNQVLFRKAKITPTKTGQFVTLWKRNNQGITQPFDHTDAFDFYLIATETAVNSGVFIFPKKVLLEHHILSDKTKDGKRGIRVYPPWDETTSKQAQKTQGWQINYFLNLSDTDHIDFEQAKYLLSKYKV